MTLYTFVERLEAMLKKRKFPRIDQNWHLKYRMLEKHVDQNSPLSSLAINVSGGGVCFTAKNEVPADAMLALEIESPDFEMPIIAMAKAVWCKKRRMDDMYDLGCEFYWVGWKDDSAQKSLADFIKDQTDACGDEACAVKE
ncbi:MAG: PilZ domain-containing protein [Deltaproteobacteria bacterium]|jgi:c-di-GMP-binding flagellar brake protein YcgR|nr:PilZ domain-containing protein [Deltaproteobacteria bacterium]